MDDVFVASLILKRIDLVARLVSAGGCNEGDRELAICWIGELTTQLVECHEGAQEADLRH